MCSWSCARIAPNGPGLALRKFQLKRLIMPTGVVKWFNRAKGYGFIVPDEGGNDVFVHISAVERAGLTNLNDGQRVEYELVQAEMESSLRKT